MNYNVANSFVDKVFFFYIFFKLFYCSITFKFIWCTFHVLGYDLHYYLLGSLGAAEYNLGEPVQKVIPLGLIPIPIDRTDS